MGANLLLTAIRQHLKLPPTHSVIMEPIKKGGSGRTIMRLKPEGHIPFIGIHYTLDRSDNANFLPVAHFLKNKAKLHVPEVIYDNTKEHLAIVEDLGNDDLISLKDEPFEVREPYYRSAFEQLDKLFYTRPPKDFELQPPFNAELYQWEQDYFIEHFVEEYLGLNGEELRQNEELKSLRERLGTSARNLVHRDFQSQNLILKDGKSWIIDFQGLRLGRQEYDLASLIYDPYLNHSVDEQARLLALWEEITEEEPLSQILAECATQRLMQALGAYGKLSAKDPWFLQHIPTACRLLTDVVKGSSLEPVLSPYLKNLPLKD